VRLTEKERLTMDLLIAGKSYRVIGERLGITASGVNQRVTSIKNKLGVDTMGEAVVIYVNEIKNRGT
jgi:DNA-binding CsgD family transcriptional regulator